jgi:hypothetical protein
MGNRLPFVAALFQHLKANVFIVSYRGYSLSEGSPSEQGIKKDIRVEVFIGELTQRQFLNISIKDKILIPERSFYKEHLLEVLFQYTLLHSQAQKYIITGWIPYLYR